MGNEGKYLTQFIVKAGKVVVHGPDGRKWRIRQPTPDEAADGLNVYRLEYERIMADSRLKALADDVEALRLEALRRANDAEAVYLLPLLLEVNNESGWQVAFDVHDQQSMAAFESIGRKTFQLWLQAFREPVQEAVFQAKKKLPLALFASCSFANLKINGHLSRGRSMRPRPSCYSTMRRYVN